MSAPEPPPFNAPVIVDARGRPARTAQTTVCPQCGGGLETRVASGGFGLRGTNCGKCGFDFHEAWHD